MKLYYYKDSVGNFGDDLNPFFWDKIWPEYAQSTKADWLVGIGSILTGKLNELAGTKLIMGSGYWPIQAGKPDLTSCRIVSVRGPLSCQALGLDEKLAITDPAILIATLISRPTKLANEIGFMPHHITHNMFDCAKIAKIAGVRYIDPTGPMHTVLNALIESPKVLVEAMHGAIVADAMGVPWQRVSIFNAKDSSKESVNFKWKDWGDSLSVETAPSFECLLPWPGRTVLRRIVKRPYVEWFLRKVANSIQNVKQTEAYRLSDRKLLSSKIKQLIECVEIIKSET